MSLPCEILYYILELVIIADCSCDLKQIVELRRTCKQFYLSVPPIIETVIYKIQEPEYKVFRELTKKHLDVDLAKGTFEFTAEFYPVIWVMLIQLSLATKKGKHREYWLFINHKLCSFNDFKELHMGNNMIEYKKFRDEEWNKQDPTQRLRLAYEIRAMKGCYEFFKRKFYKIFRKRFVSKSAQYDFIIYTASKTHRSVEELFYSKQFFINNE